MPKQKWEVGQKIRNATSYGTITDVRENHGREGDTYLGVEWDNFAGTRKHVCFYYTHDREPLFEWEKVGYSPSEQPLVDDLYQVFPGLAHEILGERLAQIQKWGDDSHQTPLFFLAVLMEEVGEVAKAILENTPENYRKECVQVAAVCVKMMQHYDAQFPPTSPVEQP